MYKPSGKATLPCSPSVVKCTLQLCNVICVLFVSLQCVVCLGAKATMQTYPCGHKVVCRKCFVKTIQVAVSQRCLPLRCVICRTRILKLKQSLNLPATASSQSLASSARSGMTLHQRQQLAPKTLSLRPAPTFRHLKQSPLSPSQLPRQSPTTLKEARLLLPSPGIQPTRRQ